MKKPLHALSVVLIIALQFSCNNRPNLIPEVRDVDFSNKDLEVEGLKAGIHGLVGMLPVTDNAQTLEAVALNVDVLVCVCLAGAAEVGYAHFIRRP